MPDIGITCWICKKDAPRGNKDPRPLGGYPEDSMEGRAWNMMNHAPMDLCEKCYATVVAEDVAS